jgi:hypothetical protein
MPASVSGRIQRLKRNSCDRYVRTESNVCEPGGPSSVEKKPGSDLDMSPRMQESSALAAWFPDFNPATTVNRISQLFKSGRLTL